MVNNSPSLSNRIGGGCCVFALWSFLSLSLFPLVVSRLFSFSIALSRVAKKTRGTRPMAQRERERERSLVVVVILVALLALLNAISMARKLGTKKCRTQNARFNKHRNERRRSLSFAVLKIFASSNRSERKRETKEGLALARSFVRVTRVCDILKNILLDGRLTRQKM